MAKPKVIKYVEFKEFGAFRAIDEISRRSYIRTNASSLFKIPLEINFKCPGNFLKNASAYLRGKLNSQSSVLNEVPSCSITLSDPSTLFMQRVRNN